MPLITRRPDRLPALSGRSCCREKKVAAIAKLAPRGPTLREELDDICVSDVSEDARCTKSCQQRRSQLKALRDRAVPQSLGLKDDADFALAVETFTYHIIEGITKLKEKRPVNTISDDGEQLSPPSLMHILVQYRKTQHDKLHLSLEHAGKLNSKDRKSESWFSDTLAGMTRLVRRKLDTEYSETGDGQKESQLKRREKNPYSIESIVNQLFPTKGGEALLVHAALKGTYHNRFCDCS